MNNKFPLNPNDGAIYELEAGIIYQYDGKLRTWNELVSETKVIELATIYRDGAMASIDFKKINRLIFPFPVSTIMGHGCSTAFLSGFLDLKSDRFLDIKGNVNYVSPLLDEDLVEPFKIQANTYAFNFDLNKDILLAYLLSNKRLNLTGDKGNIGLKGEPGVPGENYVFSGPQGIKGPTGASPEIKLSLTAEKFLVTQNPDTKLVIRHQNRTNTGLSLLERTLVK